MTTFARICLTASFFGLSVMAVSSCAESGATNNDNNYIETTYKDNGSPESAATTLYLIGYDVPKDQRKQVVAQDIATLKQYSDKRAAIKDVDAFFEDTPPKYRRDDYDSVNVSSLILCDFRDSVGCLERINNNPDPYRQSLEALSLAMGDIDILRQHSGQELVSVVPDALRSSHEITANHQYLVRPLTTQSALAYHDDPSTGLTTMCDNISFGKKLIQSKDSLVQTFVGVGLINNNLDLLEHTKEALPQSCVKALQPMALTDRSVCPIVKSEALQLKNLLLSFDETPVLFSHDASVKLINKDTQLFCNTEWKDNIRNDEMASNPIDEIKTPVLFNRTGSDIVNLAKLDYSDYQNKLLDLNARLRLWQAAIDTQCQAAVNNPEVLDSLFIEAYSGDNTPLVNYLNALLGDLNRVRALQVDNQQRLSITAYDQPKSTDETAKGNAKVGLSYLSVSCRTVQ